MIRYALLVKPSAANLIAGLIPKFEALIGNPRPAGCTKLRGFRDLWRIRVGSVKRIHVMRVAHRSEVYD